MDNISIKLTMNHRIHEILYGMVFPYLDFYDKHKFQKINKCMDRIHVKDLYDI